MDDNLALYRPMFTSRRESGRASTCAINIAKTRPGHGRKNVRVALIFPIYCRIDPPDPNRPPGVPSTGTLIRSQ
jgi:hypothetical protein